MVDTTEFTPEEEERLIQAQAAGDAADASGAAAATDEQASSEQVEASRLQMKRRLMMQFQKAMSTSTNAFSPKTRHTVLLARFLHTQVALRAICG